MSPLHRILLALVVLASAAQAALWVFLVPIFQSPDEPEHLDYALAIHANAGLLSARNTAFEQKTYHVHPQTKYLHQRTETVRVAFRPEQKMAPDYGSKRYFAALDRDAPTDLQIDRPAQLTALYPFGYYAALAVWIEIVRLCDGGVVAMFFGARLFSVVLLSISLVLSYGSLRLLNYRPSFCLLVTACIGLFPLTSFVSSYVQPDNLSFTMVSLCFYTSLRARTHFTAGSLLLTGIALGGLLATKTHFWLCVTPAVLAMVASNLLIGGNVRKCLTAGVCLVTPQLIAGIVWQWSVWGTQNYFAPPASSSDRVVAGIQLFRGAVDNYFAGPSHESFWGVYGWLDTPIKFRSPRLTAMVLLAVQIASWAVVGLTLLRIEQVASRLIRLAGAGRTKIAVRIAFSNPVMNAYFLFVALMIFLFVWTSNRFGAQGRNWFPFMLPIFLVGLSYAPKALTLPRVRTLFVGALAIGLLLYGTVGNYYARQSVRARYYPSTKVRHRPAETDSQRHAATHSKEPRTQ